MVSSTLPYACTVSPHGRFEFHHSVSALLPYVSAPLLGTQGNKSLLLEKALAYGLPKTQPILVLIYFNFNLTLLNAPPPLQKPT